MALAVRVVKITDFCISVLGFQVHCTKLNNSQLNGSQCFSNVINIQTLYCHTGPKLHVQKMNPCIMTMPHI